MTVKGFDALYEEPEDKTGRPTPLPGTDAYLAFVAEKKRREKEKGKRDAETSPPLDNKQNLSGIAEVTVPPSIPEQPTGIPKVTVPPRIPDRATGIAEVTVPPSIPEQPTGIPKVTVPLRIPDRATGITEVTVPPSIPDTATIPVEREQEVQITANFMHFDLDIFEILPTLTEGELRIYLDFVRRSYGQSPPRNTCSVTRRKLGDTAGVASPNAQVTVIQRLEQKGLIKRISTAQGKNQASKFRVFLPCEIPGRTSKTIIRYPSSNPSS